ncbi:MAG: hypothetical protein IJV44_02245 [Prevotella sp.]|nr:hypothetical protein [Prevotella sp.]MBR1546768.1 hypothetical protein [Prevotella sp.]
MKKILLVLMLFIGMNAQAQEVYNELRTKNKQLVENPQTHGLVRSISQFKVDALNYLAIKMQEEMPDSSVYFLDRQAFAMNQYVTFYIQKLVQYNEMPQALQEEMTKIFMETSKDCPLFKDKDKELVLSYYNNGESITRFSLDTDWEKAYEIIQKKMEKNR